LRSLNDDKRFSEMLGVLHLRAERQNRQIGTIGEADCTRRGVSVRYMMVLQFHVKLTVGQGPNHIAETGFMVDSFPVDGNVVLDKNRIVLHTGSDDSDERGDGDTGHGGDREPCQFTKMSLKRELVSASNESKCVTPAMCCGTDLPARKLHR
jgi:hypothetical protein